MLPKEVSLISIIGNRPAVVPIVCDESTLQHVGIGVSCLADLTDLGILRNSASPAAKLPAA